MRQENKKLDYVVCKCDDDHDGYHDDQNDGFDLFVDDKYLKKDSTVTKTSKKIATTSSSQFNVPLRGLL